LVDEHVAGITQSVEGADPEEGSHDMGSAEALDVEDALKIPPFQTAAGMWREVRYSDRFDLQLPLRSSIAPAIPGAPTDSSRG
jgi:hypothetical protein